jgi:hypothetical protein
MAKPAWTPWHQVVKLRDDVRSGELSLATFAADLYQVLMGEAKPVYQDPKEFFALTYPTYNLRELSKDIVLRLAGKNDKAVRQLALPYGGGKTHTLITLYHLVNDPQALPDLPAVREFREAFGVEPPRASVGALCFDKLDVEKGMEVISPKGEKRWLKHPWSVLAWQLAGEDGLKIVSDGGKERETAPAENLLVQLLKLVRSKELSVLVLVDEVLMYAREKAGSDGNWRSRLQNFFQYLTQAVSKTDRCAMVASLLASDPAKMDAVGREIYNGLDMILGRDREETVQTVSKDDVAEVLRRRFFKPESLKDREAFRPHVVAALKGIMEIDEQTKKDGKAAEERYLKSYPFNPDLTDVLYAKWTQLERFQKTRGVLRTFALGLRDAEKWDQSPLVGANIFLQAPDKSGLSEAAREPATVADFEEYDNRRYDWSGILEEELKKAAAIQGDYPALQYREVEQAVISVFLHSQPIGRQASIRELLVLLGATRPDRIELEKALRRWTELSWFLDEAAIGQGPGDGSTLPKSWRLGFKPNLRQMHFDAMSRVPDELVEARLLDEIARAKNLTAGASAAGAKVHTLPQRPNDIEDDGEFHFAVLGPKAASESGKPSAESKRFIEETTAADRPRVYRNAVVLATPSKEGVDMVKSRIREYLGWEEVRGMLKEQKIDPIREQTLALHIDTSRRAIPEAIQLAWSIVVTLSEKGEVHAFKISPSSEPLFASIKKEAKSRIQDTAITAEALLPEGPYNLWRSGETRQWVKTLVGAFAQFAHLPKMLNRGAIVDTLVRGCEEGAFVLRVMRPDKSVKTWWRTRPDDSALKDPGLEVVLPQAAELSDLDFELLAPPRLPSLWPGSDLTVQAVYDYFSGGKVVKVDRGGYQEPVPIPKAPVNVIDDAVRTAVRQGRLWLTAAPTSLLAEEIPAGVLTPSAVLQAPPEVIPATQLLPQNLPAAWKDGQTTALALVAALSQQKGKSLPWGTVKQAITGAFNARFLERTTDLGVWPCDFAAAGAVAIRIPKVEGPGHKAEEPKPGVKVTSAELRPNEVQDLADSVADLTKAAAGHQLRFVVQVELGGEKMAPDTVVAEVNKVLEKVSAKLKLQ